MKKCLGFVLVAKCKFCGRVFDPHLVDITEHEKSCEVYLQDQLEGHVARREAMQKAGEPWHPTNKRQRRKV